MGDPQLKCKAIEDFDGKVVCPIMEYQKENPDSLWNKIKNFGGKNVGEAG